MLYLVHENAPTIDKAKEVTINEPRFILNKLNEIDVLSDDVSIIRASDEIIKLIDGIVPSAVYVEGFETEDYIPSAKALSLHSPACTYEELLLKMSGIHEPEISKSENVINEDSTSD